MPTSGELVTDGTVASPVTVNSPASGTRSLDHVASPVVGPVQHVVRLRAERDKVARPGGGCPGAIGLGLGHLSVGVLDAAPLVTGAWRIAARPGVGPRAVTTSSYECRGEALR